VNEDRTLVCLESSEERMRDILTNYKGKHAYFTDSDLNDMLTSIALEPIEKEDGRRLFSNFKLA
jgi:hypothetical protein